MSETTKSAPSARQDLVGGILAVAFGLFAFGIAWSYPMGSLLRMGPGFFPCTIAVLIVLLGLAMIAGGVRSWRKEAAASVRVPTESLLDMIRPRSVLMIGAGIALFALLLERAGVVPATLVLALVSSLAEPKWQPRRALILVVAVTALVYLIFIVILQIPIKAVNL